MQIFLLWRSPAVVPQGSEGATGSRHPRSVAERLARLFSPLFPEAPAAHVRSMGPVHLAWLELPIAGLRAPRFEEQGDRWALAPDYPLNTRRLLRSHGALPADGRPLLALARELESRAEAYVRELIPPAALLWNTAGGEIRVQNDGLGQAQLLEHDDGQVWALTNRVMALRALDLPLRPVAPEWAARLVTHWFPLDRSGYAGVRVLAGGTGLRVAAGRTTRTRHDPVTDWVHPEPRPRGESLELGRNALLNTLSDAMELWECPTVGLSGGWDSRAVASCLRTLGSSFSLRVRGQETHFDVIVAAELARVAGLPLRIKAEGGIPAPTTEGCRSSIQRALLWQGGYFATKKHKNFLAREKRSGLDGGVINVMGQHAGLGKADFVVKIDATRCPPSEHEPRLLEALFAGAPSGLRPDRMEEARELVRSSYRAGAERGLEGLGPLLFFYLNEFTRRWGSATVASQTGMVVAPFLCPDLIRASFGLPAEELPSKPLHRYITGRHAPDWAGIPYADQVTEEDFRNGRLPRVEPGQVAGKPAEAELPRWRSVRHHRKYHYKYYWKDVGQPLIEEALQQGGFWTEIFAPEVVRERWMTSGSTADALALTHLLPGVVADAWPAGRPQA